MIGFGLFVFALVLVYLLYYTFLIVGDLNKKGQKHAGSASASAGGADGGQGRDAEDESVEVTESEDGFELAGAGYSAASAASETGGSNSSGEAGAGADVKQLSAEEEARAREEAEAQAQEETCEQLRDEIEEVQGNLEKKAHEFRLEGGMHDKELLKSVMQQFSQRGMKVQLGFRPEIENI